MRIKNYVSESQIEIHGIFGPMIKWDGVVFKVRSFPLPESEAFAERSDEDSLTEYFPQSINVFPSDFSRCFASSINSSKMSGVLPSIFGYTLID